MSCAKSMSRRNALQVIAGRRIEIPAFSNHLSQFLEPERGSVLEREGTSRRYFYRFTDPIFQPYVVLTGLSEELISDEQLRDLQDREPGETTIPGEHESSVPQRLF